MSTPKLTNFEDSPECAKRVARLTLAKRSAEPRPQNSKRSHGAKNSFSGRGTVFQKGIPVFYKGNPVFYKGNPVFYKGNPACNKGNPAFKKGNPDLRKGNPVFNLDGIWELGGAPGAQGGQVVI